MVKFDLWKTAITRRKDFAKKNQKEEIYTKSRVGETSVDDIEVSDIFKNTYREYEKEKRY